jgi:hypothetical protein
MNREAGHDPKINNLPLPSTTNGGHSMNTPDEEGKQINLTDKEAEELAFRAQEGDPDSLILLLEGIKEKNSDTQAFILIQSAIDEIIRLGSFYPDLKDDYLRILIRKFRQQ